MEELKMTYFHFKRTVLPLLVAASTCLAAPALALPNFEPQPELVSEPLSQLTQAKTEKEMFAKYMQEASTHLDLAEHDLAHDYLDSARHWMLTFSDSLVSERTAYSWDDLRTMEHTLLNHYERLGRAYQMAGRPDRAVLAAQSGLDVSPYYQPLLAQQNQSFVALLSR